jgi:transcriptional regulator with XRE-family HTH domain
MPKTLNSVTLGNNCIKFIEDYCKRKDISEAAFSRKFGKNNRWVSDLRRGKNTNLPSKELAVQMCLTLNVSPDDILLHEGKTQDETKKCLEDIETVRKLVEAEGIKEAPDPKTEGVSPTVQELFDFIDTATDAELNELLRYAQFLMSKR